MEVKSMYYLAVDLGYLSEEVSLIRRGQLQLVINAISKLKKFLKPQ